MHAGCPDYTDVLITYMVSWLYRCPEYACRVSWLYGCPVLIIMVSWLYGCPVYTGVLIIMVSWLYGCPGHAECPDYTIWVSWIIQGVLIIRVSWICRVSWLYRCLDYVHGVLIIQRVHYTVVPQIFPMWSFVFSAQKCHTLLDRRRSDSDEVAPPPKREEPAEVKVSKSGDVVSMSVEETKWVWPPFTGYLIHVNAQCVNWCTLCNQDTLGFVPLWCMIGQDTFLMPEVPALWVPQWFFWLTRV